MRPTSYVPSVSRPVYSKMLGRLSISSLGTEVSAKALGELQGMGQDVGSAAGLRDRLPTAHRATGTSQRAARWVLARTGGLVLGEEVRGGRMCKANRKAGLRGEPKNKRNASPRRGRRASQRQGHCRRCSSMRSHAIAKKQSRGEKRNEGRCRTGCWKVPKRQSTAPGRRTAGNGDEAAKISPPFPDTCQAVQHSLAVVISVTQTTLLGYGPV